MRCPRCGKEMAVTHYTDAYVTYKVLEATNDGVVLDPRSRNVLTYDDQEAQCEECEQQLDLPRHHQVRFNVRPGRRVVLAQFEVGAAQGMSDESVRDDVAAKLEDLGGASATVEVLT